MQANKHYLVMGKTDKLQTFNAVCEFLGTGVPTAKSVGLLFVSVQPLFSL